MNTGIYTKLIIIYNNSLFLFDLFTVNSSRFAQFANTPSWGLNHFECKCIVGNIYFFSSVYSQIRQIQITAAIATQQFISSHL